MANAFDKRKKRNALYFLSFISCGFDNLKLICMKKTAITVSVSSGTSAVQEWQHFFQTNTSELFEAIEQVKESVNNFLSLLISQNEDTYLRDQLELTEHYDMEEENKADNVSGFIKNLTVDNEKFNRGKNRTFNCFHQAKKLKK